MKINKKSNKLPVVVEEKNNYDDYDDYDDYTGSESIFAGFENVLINTFRQNWNVYYNTWEIFICQKQFSNFL